MVFLGEPRTGDSAHAHEPGLAMRIPMILLAAGCFAVGLLSPLVVRSMGARCRAGGGAPGRGAAGGRLEHAGVVRRGRRWDCSLLIGLVAALRKALLAGRPIGATGTWDCGYARPSATMQYTASSYAQPLTDLFGLVLRTHRRGTPPAGVFPAGASLATETADVCQQEIFRPVFSSIGWGLSKLRWLQTGRVQLYVLYIALTLLVLLAWELK